MGYDLHITRRSNWAQKGNDITSEEWLSIVANDPELRLQSENGPFFVIWNGPSSLESPWLDWSHGQIHSKNPDDALIEKMVMIARKLGAKVQGDDGEIYRSARDAHKTPKRVPPTPIMLSLIVGGVVLYFAFVELVMFLMYHRLDSNSSWPLLIGIVPWAIVIVVSFKVLLAVRAGRAGRRIPKMKLGEILPADEMKWKYDLTIENYKPIHLDPEKVPEGLRGLTPVAEKWGIGDDVIRGDLHEKVSQAEKQALKSSLDGRTRAISQWLDSFGEGEMTEEAATFMFMLEGLDEMGIGVNPTEDFHK